MFIKWAGIFFVIALIAPVFGFTGVAVLFACLITGRMTLSQRSDRLNIEPSHPPKR